MYPNTHIYLLQMALHYLLLLLYFGWRITSCIRHHVMFWSLVIDRPFGFCRCLVYVPCDDNLDTVHSSNVYHGGLSGP